MKAADREDFLARLHASSWQLGLVVTGGGSLAISDLLTVPGASATVLEAVVPYARAALAEYLGHPVERACCAETVRAMARVAHARAAQLGRDSPRVLGVACSAVLASAGPARSPHRVHVGYQSGQKERSFAIELAAGERDRLAEERLTADLLLYGIAEATRIPWPGEPPRLLPGERGEASP